MTIDRTRNPLPYGKLVRGSMKLQEHMDPGYLTGNAGIAIHFEGWTEGTAIEDDNGTYVLVSMDPKGQVSVHIHRGERVLLQYECISEDAERMLNPFLELEERR